MNGLSHYNIGMFSKALKMSPKRLTTGKNEKNIYFLHVPARKFIGQKQLV